jgi:hypothetical protein
MPTTNISVDLGSEAADSLEFLATAIERELTRLDALEAAAVPGASRDDADFQRWSHQIRGALVALRGLGLLLTDEQAKQCRHLWDAALKHTTENLGACPIEWFAAVQGLDTVLPWVEEAKA